MREAVTREQDGRLDLGVVLRVLSSEELSALRFTARKPDVVSLTRWPTIMETIAAKMRIPTRRRRVPR